MAADDAGFLVRAASLAKRIYSLSPSTRCIELLARLSESLEERVEAIGWHRQLIERRTMLGDGQGVVSSMDAIQRLGR